MDDDNISLARLVNQRLPSGAEAEQVLQAIVLGDADAIVVQGKDGPRVYTLTDAGEPYRLLVEQMSEAALILDADGTVLYSNGRMAGFLRRPQLAGLTVTGLVPQSARPRTEALLEAGLVRRVVDELPMLAIDGEELTVRLAAAPMLFDGRPAITLVATPLDEIAALKAANQRIATINSGLEQQIRDRTLQLVQAQKMEVIGQMTGGVAHDFNNVLQGLGSCLEVLAGYIPEGRPRAIFNAAQQTIDRGARLTGALLAVARHQTLAPEPLDMRKLFEDIRPLLERTLGGLIGVVIDAAPTIPAALADRAQVESAILNLAINARDAMPEGGILTLRAAPETIGEDGRGPAPGPYLAVSVADTGSGMDAETLARACDPFFTTKAVGKGSGLGLAMVSGMAQQSGGALRIDSWPGGGTVVTLLLPVVEAKTAAHPAPTGDGTTPDGGGASVLVVDDDDLVRAGLEISLSGLGYRVLAANSGETALNILRQEGRVDALLTDFAMPGMNGAALVQEIRRISPDIPTILMTGYDDNPVSIQVSGRLLKPFRLQDLARHLAAILTKT